MRVGHTQNALNLKEYGYAIHARWEPTAFENTAAAIAMNRWNIGCRNKFHAQLDKL
jgi:hypothetical protein